MKNLSKLSNNLFSKDHRTASISAIVLVLTILFSFSLYYFKSNIANNELRRLMNEGRYDRVIGVGESILKSNPNDPELIKPLAEAYVMRGRYSENSSSNIRRSRILLTKSGFDAEKDPEALRILGEGLVVGGNYVAARGYFQRSASFNPDDSKTWVAFGDLEYRLLNFDKAISLFEKALAIDNSSVEAKLGIARVEYRNGNLDKAKSSLAGLVSSSNNAMTVANIYGLIGAIELQKNDLSSAEVYFKKALNINSSMPTVLVDYARLLLKGSNRDGIDPFKSTAKSLEYATLARKIDASNINAYILLAEIGRIRNDNSMLNDNLSKAKNLLPRSLLVSDEKKVISNRISILSKD